MVIIIQDISNQEKLEQMRKDFVANVSHEFRTPLTIIRGNLEGLYDEVIPKEEVHENYFRLLQDIPFIGETFYKADKGTGLGISIAKHLIKLLNCQLKIESKVNVGTQVKIIFLGLIVISLVIFLLYKQRKS